MTPKNTDRKGWSTADEIEFLAGLGTHAPSRSESPAQTQRQILRRYLDAASRRHDWGTMDQGVVVRQARRMLGQRDAP